MWSHLERTNINFTLSLTQSFNQSFTQSFTQSLNHSYIAGSQSNGVWRHFERARINELQPLLNLSLNHSFSHSLSHSLNHSPVHILQGHSRMVCGVTWSERESTSCNLYSIIHSIIHSLIHSIIEPFIYYRVIVAWCVESLRASGNQRVATSTQSFTQSFTLSSSQSLNHSFITGS